MPVSVVSLLDLSVKQTEDMMTVPLGLPFSGFSFLHFRIIMMMSKAEMLEAENILMT